MVIDHVPTRMILQVTGRTPPRGPVTGGGLSAGTEKCRHQRSCGYKHPEGPVVVAGRRDLG